MNAKLERAKLVILLFAGAALIYGASLIIFGDSWLGWFVRIVLLILMGFGIGYGPKMKEIDDAEKRARVRKK